MKLTAHLNELPAELQPLDIRPVQEDPNRVWGHKQPGQVMFDTPPEDPAVVRSPVFKGRIINKFSIVKMDFY